MINQLRIIAGSSYLKQQRDQHASLARSSRPLVLILLFVGILLFIMSILLAIFSEQTLLSYVGLAATVAMLFYAGKLSDWGVNLRRKSGHYAQGIAGEEQLVKTLQSIPWLDSSWSLYRNVTLPGRQDDIDAILIGRQGVYALEVKAYTGKYRYVGKRWQKQGRRKRWYTVHKDPASQAKANAQRLSAYLETQGVALFVQPRIVWAGNSQLILSRQEVTVWLISGAKTSYIEQDLKQQRGLSVATINNINQILDTV